MFRDKENPFVGSNGPIVQPRLLTWSILMAHNCMNIGQILTKPVPIDRSWPGLSIGAGWVKIWPILTKLWTIKVTHVNNRGWAVVFLLHACRLVGAWFLLHVQQVCFPYFWASLFLSNNVTWNVILKTKFSVLIVIHVSFPKFYGLYVIRRLEDEHGNNALNVCEINGFMSSPVEPHPKGLQNQARILSGAAIAAIRVQSLTLAHGFQLITYLYQTIWMWKNPQ